MLDKLLEFLKNHTKVIIAVTLTGIGAVTVGYNKGCTMGFEPEPTPQVAPATP